MKLYIDVTESYAWRGKVTGIIRVMDELASRFFEDPDMEAIFVVWNEKGRLFERIDYQEIIDIRKAPALIDDNAHMTEEGLIWTFKNNILKLPYAKATYKKLKGRKSPANVGVIFEKGSTLFMLHGGVWSSQYYARYVINLKQEINLILKSVLYDLCPVRVPQFCSEGIRVIFDRHMRKLLPETDTILAISENTASEAREWLREFSDKTLPTIQTFRLGDEIGQQKSVPLTRLPKEFIICVGTIEARKNHLSLYFAYKRAKERQIELPDIVIAGRRGWLADDVYEMITTDPGIKNKFIFLNNVDDHELCWLYENALFSVYPSFYEGWGLPVAESLLRGLPCLASYSSSIPEIAGDLIDYFSPYAPEELLDRLHTYTTNPQLIKDKKTLIQSRYKPTLWDESYRQIVEILSKP